MLKVELTRHAITRMQERKISLIEINAALTPPTNIKSGKGEKFVAEKNGIRVVYSVRNGKIVVVTVTRQ